jgi:hypothetical protein
MPLLVPGDVAVAIHSHRAGGKIAPLDGFRPRGLQYPPVKEIAMPTKHTKQVKLASVTSI